MINDQQWSTCRQLHPDVKVSVESRWKLHGTNIRILKNSSYSSPFAHFRNVIPTQSALCKGDLRRTLDHCQPIGHQPPELASIRPIDKSSIYLRCFLPYPPQNLHFVLDLLNCPYASHVFVTCSSSDFCFVFPAKLPACWLPGTVAAAASATTSAARLQEGAANDVGPHWILLCECIQVLEIDQIWPTPKMKISNN